MGGPSDDWRATRQQRGLQDRPDKWYIYWGLGATWVSYPTKRGDTIADFAHLILAKDRRC